VTVDLWGSLVENALLCIAFSKKYRYFVYGVEKPYRNDVKISVRKDVILMQLLQDKGGILVEFCDLSRLYSCKFHLEITLY